jgi:hypothetical protein
MATLQKTIPAYPYVQYNDDEDIVAFFTQANAMTQQYVDWFNQTTLPNYTSDRIVGDLLDWVGAGIYGYPRPSLPGVGAKNIGPLDTYGPNEPVPLSFQSNTPATLTLVTDDLYKRLLTWHFYKGDGFQFSIRWLKRRIMRFLVGVNGTAPDVDQTYQISVTFGSGNSVALTCPVYSSAAALASAIGSGAAETPFQYAFTLTPSGAVIPYL